MSKVTNRYHGADVESIYDDTTGDSSHVIEGKSFDSLGAAIAEARKIGPKLEAARQKRREEEEMRIVKEKNAAVAKAKAEAAANPNE
jgi:hypothetical protein